MSAICSRGTTVWLLKASDGTPFNEIFATEALATKYIEDYRDRILWYTITPFLVRHNVEECPVPKPREPNIMSMF